MTNRPLNHWGASLWNFIHTISIIDIDEPILQIQQSKNVIHILRGIADIIPCHKCATHYQTFFHNVIDTREPYEKMELFRLMVEYHNMVNIKLNKPIVRYEDACLLWAKTI